MKDLVKIIECPRDAWQGLSAPIAPDVKANYLHKLIDAGFTHIDAVSFVSPLAVPQMADSEQVLACLMPPEHVEIIGIVVNEKGAQRAIQTEAVQTLGFPYSISPQFLQRNQHQTPEESLDMLVSIAALAADADLNVVAYLSMAFGNPYGDAWTIDEVNDACDLLVDSGVGQISLADTVGLASPDQISETVGTVLAQHPEIEIGIHLHARPAEAALRCCNRRPWWMPFRSGRDGWEHPHRDTDRGINRVWRPGTQGGTTGSIDDGKRGDCDTLWNSCAVASSYSERRSRCR